LCLLVLASIHILEFSVGHDEDFLLGITAGERLVIHSVNGMLALFFADKID